MNTDEPLTAMRSSNVEEIMSASKHPVMLINEVLDLTQIEPGMLTIALEKVSLNSVFICPGRWLKNVLLISLMILMRVTAG